MSSTVRNLSVPASNASDVSKLETAENSGSKLFSDALTTLGVDGPDALATGLAGLKFDSSGKAAVKLSDGTSASATKSADGKVSLDVKGTTVQFFPTDKTFGIQLEGARWSLVKMDANTWNRSTALDNGAHSQASVRKNSDGTYTATATEQTGGKGRATGSVAMATSRDQWAALNMADDAVDYSLTTGQKATVQQYLPDGEPTPENSILESTVSNKDDTGKAVTEGQSTLLGSDNMATNTADPVSTEGDNAITDGLSKSIADLGTGNKKSTFTSTSPTSPSKLTGSTTDSTNDGTTDVSEAAAFHTKWTSMGGGQNAAQEAQGLAWQRALTQGKAPTSADVAKATSDLQTATSTASTQTLSATTTGEPSAGEVAPASVQDGIKALHTRKGTDFNNALNTYTADYAKRTGKDATDPKVQYDAAKNFGSDIHQSLAGSVDPAQLKTVDGFLLSVMEQQGVQAYDMAAHASPPDTKAQKSVAADLAGLAEMGAESGYKFGDSTNIGAYFIQGNSDSDNQATLKAYQADLESARKDIAA